MSLVDVVPDRAKAAASGHGFWPAQHQWCLAQLDNEGCGRRGSASFVVSALRASASCGSASITMGMLDGHSRYAVAKCVDVS